MAQKPSIPKGTRDFGPQEMARRNYIFNTIREVYKLYGFQQIETPAMENLSVLMGKYGEEGDKLLFKILNSGDFLRDVPAGGLQEGATGRLAAQLCEKGLRYDLTVPFARYVVQHREELSLPFRRYQIQPVWRADRPQKGRYREFYQCDADVVGSDSLLNEVELIHIMDTVFGRLGIRVCIKVNNRKILSGIAELIGAADKIVDITVAIDKLDKIGLEGVNEELRQDGLTEQQIARLQPIIAMEGSNEQKIATMREALAQSEVGQKGLDEVAFVLARVGDVASQVQLDPTLARGLDYYTGCIFEVKALDVQIGSITGGGRYDNLTGIFGMPGLSGVGISFGADRIYDVMGQLNLYPEALATSTQLLFLNFGIQEADYCLPLLQQVRQAGVSAEIYPDAAKLKKQMQYANARMLPYVAMAGEDEAKAGEITLKNMITGQQERVKPAELIKKLKE